MDTAFFFSQNERYEAWSLPPTWDAGRSGATVLARERENGRIVVIKLTDNRAAVFEKRREELHNETRSLKALRGQGVPELLDYGDFRREALNYEAYYLTIEYVQAARVEEQAASPEKLGVEERLRILAAFFKLLAAAHRRGIVNNDVDLKHLFWDKEAHRLTVIDWGNARLFAGEAPARETAFDMQRSAEIVWALVTGQPPEQVSDGAALQANRLPGFPPLPPVVERLCTWAVGEKSEEAGALPAEAAEAAGEAAQSAGREGPAEQPFPSAARIAGAFRSLAFGTLESGERHAPLAMDPALRESIFREREAPPVRPEPEVSPPAEVGKGEKHHLRFGLPSVS